MRNKSAVADLLARRLNLNAVRILGLVDRLTSAGVAPRIEGSRRFPPALMDTDIVRMMIASLTDRGLGHAVENVEAFSALTSASGLRFYDALLRVLQGETDVSNGGLVIRFDPKSVVVTSDDGETRFGEPSSPDDTSRAVFVSGSALAATAEELRGHSPAEADVIVGISRLGHSLKAG